MQEDAGGGEVVGEPGDAGPQEPGDDLLRPGAIARASGRLHELPAAGGDRIGGRDLAAGRQVGAGGERSRPSAGGQRGER